MHAALHRDLRDTRQLLPLGIDKRRRIADDEDLRMSRDRQVALDDYAPGAVERHAERREQG